MATRSHNCVPESCLRRDFFLSHPPLTRVHIHQAASSTINQGSIERKKTSPTIKTPAVIAIRLVCDLACFVMKRHRGRIDIPVRFR